MIFRKSGSINDSQRGFTLIELIVVLCIIGVMAGGAVTTILQSLEVNDRSSDRMYAVKQVENAGYWISYDSKMTQNITTDDDLGTAETEVLTLVWAGWERYDQQKNQYIDTHAVRYVYDADKLLRYQRITTNKYDSNGYYVGTTESQNSMCVAEHITAVSIPSMVGNTLTVTITASVGEATEERTHEIIPRPS